MALENNKQAARLRLHPRLRVQAAARPSSAVEEQRQRVALERLLRAMVTKAIGKENSTRTTKGEPK